MEKRKAIIFAAIAVAVLVTAMSVGCVDQQKKEEIKEDLNKTKRDIETGRAIEKINQSEAAEELREEVKKAEEEIGKEVEKAVTEVEKAVAGVEKKVEGAKEDVSEAAKKLVEEEEEAFKTVETGAKGIVEGINETKHK